MIKCFLLSSNLQPSCRSSCQLPSLSLQSSNIRLQVHCSLTKQGQQFLTSVVTSANPHDPSLIRRTINKFVVSSPKHVTLGTLSYLLSPSSAKASVSHLVLPLYARIKEASWFIWNSKLVADVIALLYKEGHVDEVEHLISEAVSNFCVNERELVSFYCNLLNSHVKHSSDGGFSRAHDHLTELISTSSSVYVKRRAYESVVSGFCSMGYPHEAEEMIDQMVSSGLKPSMFEYRSVVEGYGRAGLFDEMLRNVASMENRGYPLDTVSANMVLSSYGAQNRLFEMASWLRQMRDRDIGLSVRSYNSVLNSCPAIVSLSQCSDTCPVSIEELLETLNSDDVSLLVKELIRSEVLVEIVEWDSSTWKLDLHGMHLGTAYLMLLQWMEELRCRFSSRQCEIPAEVVVVCGVGKHSSTRGKSPVKALVKELMLRTGSPMRIDRMNKGCFVAKGKSVKEWLCRSM